MVHHSAVVSLGHLHAEPDLAVPALMKDFPGNDTLLRSLILVSLGRFESKGRESVPMLVEALNDNDESVRSSAAFALKQIDPEAAAKAGVK
jgi:HEAT repeat protein